MKNFKPFVFSICAMVFLLSCNNDDDASDCDFDTIIDLGLYELPSPSLYTILNAEIDDDCLEITFGASGCDGESWEVQLVSDFPLVAGSTGGANLSLKLMNLEVCTAYFIKIHSFDLSDIHGDNMRTIFSLEGWEGLLQIDN